MVMERRTGDVRTPVEIGALDTQLRLLKLEQDITWRQLEQQPEGTAPDWLINNIYEEIRYEQQANLSQSPLFKEIKLAAVLITVSDRADDDQAPFDPLDYIGALNDSAKVFFRSAVEAATLMGREISASGFDFDWYFRRHLRVFTYKRLPHGPLMTQEEAIEAAANVFDEGWKQFERYAENWREIIDRHPLLFNGLGRDYQPEVEAGIGLVIGIFKASMERPYQSHLARESRYQH